MGNSQHYMGSVLDLSSCHWFAGEMFYIGYQMDAKPPKYWYGGVDPEGVHQFEVMVELKEGVMMHDMAITQVRNCHGPQ